MPQDHWLISAITYPLIRARLLALRAVSIILIRNWGRSGTTAAQLPPCHYCQAVRLSITPTTRLPLQPISVEGRGPMDRPQILALLNLLRRTSSLAASLAWMFPTL